MKKSFMTRILATGLSFAMAFSMAAATNVTPASAASKPVLVDAVTGGSGRAVTVNVGEVAKLKIDATTGETYAVSSVKKSSKKIKAAVSKKGTVVYVRGVAETGEKDSAIRVFFKVKKNGKDSKRTFVSKVKVVTPVEEVAKITEATQKESKKVAVTFSKAVDAVKPADFTIVRVDGNIVIPVKAVKLADDKKSATIETYTDMKDGKEYKVSYTAADEAKTVSEKNFIATDAKVAKLAVSTTTIPANDFTEVKINTIDAQGVLLGSYKFSDLGKQKITADVKCSANGYKQNDEIFLKKAGDTAEIKAVLHTYQYENGVEKDTIEETFIVTAVDETYAGYTFNYSLVGATAGEPAWKASTYKQNTAIPVNETSRAYFYFTNASDKDKTNMFSISSANTDIVIVGGTIAKNQPASITGVKEGSTYLLVKDEKKNLVASLPVSVSAKRKATRLELSKSTVTVSKAASQAAIDIIPTVYDQYNEKIKNDVTLAVKELTVKVPGSGVLAADNVNNKFVVTGAGKTEGNYYYEVSAKVGDVEVKNNVNVTVNKPDGSVYTYGIDLDSTVDVAVDEDAATTANKYQTIRIARYQGGVLKDYLSTASLASIKISGLDKDNEVTLPAVKSDGAVMTVTCGAVVTGSALKQVVKSGNYKVEVDIQTSATEKTSLTETFVVKNDQLAKYGVNVKIDNMNDYSKNTTYVGVGQIKNALNNHDIFEVTRDNAGATDYTIDHVNSTTVAGNSNQVYVKSVEATVTINNIKIYVVLPVERTFTMRD